MMTQSEMGEERFGMETVSSWNMKCSGSIKEEGK